MNKNRNKLILLAIIFVSSFCMQSSRANNNWEHRDIKIVTCFPQGPHECGFYALLHGLQGLRNLTNLTHNEAITIINGWIKHIGKPHNINSTDMEKIIAKEFLSQENQQLCIINSPTEACALLTNPTFRLNKIRALAKRLFQKQKTTVVLLQTGAETLELANKKSENFIGHWITLTLQSQAKDTLSITIKNSTDSTAQGNVSQAAEHGIKALYDVFLNWNFEQTQTISQNKSQEQDTTALDHITNQEPNKHAKAHKKLKKQNNPILAATEKRLKKLKQHRTGTSKPTNTKQLQFPSKRKNNSAKEIKKLRKQKHNEWKNKREEPSNNIKNHTAPKPQLNQLLEDEKLAQKLQELENKNQEQHITDEELAHQLDTELNKK
ncbi:MAG: hypothetical protein V1855_04310 [bacterium]